MQDTRSRANPKSSPHSLLVQHLDENNPIRRFRCTPRADQQRLSPGPHWRGSSTGTVSTPSFAAWAARSGGARCSARWRSRLRRAEPGRNHPDSPAGHASSRTSYPTAPPSARATSRTAIPRSAPGAACRRPAAIAACMAGRTAPAARAARPAAIAAQRARASATASVRGRRASATSGSAPGGDRNQTRDRSGVTFTVTRTASAVIPSSSRELAASRCLAAAASFLDGIGMTG